jgi:hypothetical protein
MCCGPSRFPAHTHYIHIHIYIPSWMQGLLERDGLSMWRFGMMVRVFRRFMSTSHIGDSDLLRLEKKIQSHHQCLNIWRKVKSQGPPQ